jgi:antirestriction protein
MNTIKELVENGFDEDEILDFIEDHGKDNLEHYVQFCELSNDYDVDALNLYLNNIGDLDNFAEAYSGHHRSFEAFAEDLFDEMYAQDIPDHIKSYIDYEKFARDLKYDYWEENGYVFRNL